MASLDLLEDCTFDQLNEMYGDGEVPDPDRLDGDFRGSVPAVSSDSLLGTLSRPTSILSGFGLLPWSGKSFRASEGTGHNRLLDRLSVAPFEVDQGVSWYDDRECLVLDYGIEGNPFVLGVIRDEVREVDSGVLLGQMYLEPTSSLVLYFALEQN